MEGWITMHRLVLPPKRFQPCHWPIFDSIRYRSWFRHLEERREKIGLLEMARVEYRNQQSQRLDPQRFAAEKWGVDERELRDYISYFDGVGKDINKTQQHALDSAYLYYCTNNGEISFRYSVFDACKLYGIKPRHLHELWDTCPKFYPTGYSIGRA